jgi:transcriptional regulator with XRE-family HTH domain
VDYQLESGNKLLDDCIASNGRTSLNGHASSNGHAALNGHAASNGTHATALAKSGPERNGEALSSGSADNPAVANGSSTRRKPAAQQPTHLHQLREARRRQGLSVRCVAQRLNLSVGEVRAQEEERADIMLSELYRWQGVLEVPLEELLNEPQDTLSPRVLMRARMLRIMKTARALRAQARSESESRLAKLMISQLIEIMPELKEVAAWPTVGHRRSADELGRIAEHPVPDDFMHEAS